ncbi:MAG: GNAT family N-acetyltransferase [Nocardioidaceae bacterium]
MPPRAPFRLSGTQTGLRVLGPTDLPALLDLVSRDPVIHLFAEFRARTTDLDRRRLAGEFWGYVEDGELVSACHAGANLVPVEATEAALDAFAARAIVQGRHCATIVGPLGQVRGLWDRVKPSWAPARAFRWHQPHLELARQVQVAPDPLVRITTLADLDAVYPACVAMHTEELGVSPEAGGSSMYRARVSQLIEKRWSFARIEQGKVLFKAEVASVTEHACQVQGVYVDPAHRGQGLATAGMAAVAEYARHEIAPIVSLYVNEHNLPARRAYEKVGFVQTAEFGTVMF